VKGPLPEIKKDRVRTEAIADSLREAILDGYYKPAEKLDQEAIAEELRVSRTPVREAIRILASEGFVEVKAHHGAYINALSRKDVEEIYEARLLLEPELFRKVTDYIPDPVLQDLERRIIETHLEVERGDFTHHFISDTIFEETVLSYSPNRVLKELLLSLKNRFSVARYFALRQSPPLMLQSLEEHCEILRAMRARNPERAAELARTHLANSAARIESLVR
jgi:DNA-binding GntR family transcriptional regulator